MTNGDKREICLNCVYSYFTDRKNLKSFKWCNYLDMTGEQRPRSKTQCFGFKKRGDGDESNYKYTNPSRGD